MKTFIKIKFIFGTLLLIVSLIGIVLIIGNAIGFWEINFSTQTIVFLGFTSLLSAFLMINTTKFNSKNSSEKQ